MQYLDKSELRKLFTVAYERDRHIHLLLVTMFWSGLRITEALSIHGRDVIDGQLFVRRLKKSRPTVHKLHIDADPIFDSSPLIDLANANFDSRLFEYTPQWINKRLKQWAAEAGLHPAKAHTHAIGKHSICMLLWQNLRDLNVVQDWVGHVSPSSTLVYLRADAAAKAQECVAAMSI